MKRRAPRRPTKSPHPAHDHSAKHCRAIVLVDGTAIRKKIKKEYEKALRDLDIARQRLDQYHQTDLPEFTRWLNSHFGALLTEIRELAQKIAVDDELVFLVQSEIMFEGGSYARAYKRVLERLEKPEPPPDPSAHGQAPGQDRNPFGSEPGPEKFDFDQDSAEEFFDQYFGGAGPGAQSQEKSRPDRGFQSNSARPPQRASRLKELYRTLARRLHPDAQQEMTAQKLAWWHQTQAAYQAGDVEQLEVILSLCEISEHGTTNHTSASLLQRITATLKNSLRELKRQATQLKRDPAWNFSRRPDHEVMAERMRRDLTNDLRAMREHWRQTQATIAKWKAAAERLKPRGKKHPRENMDFLF